MCLTVYIYIIFLHNSITTSGLYKYTLPDLACTKITYSVSGSQWSKDTSRGPAHVMSNAECVCQDTYDRRSGGPALMRSDHYIIQIIQDRSTYEIIITSYHCSTTILPKLVRLFYPIHVCRFRIACILYIQDLFNVV